MVTQNNEDIGFEEQRG